MRVLEASPTMFHTAGCRLTTDARFSPRRVVYRASSGSSQGAVRPFDLLPARTQARAGSMEQSRSSSYARARCFRSGFRRRVAPARSAHSLQRAPSLETACARRDERTLFFLLFRLLTRRDTTG